MGMEIRNPAYPLIANLWIAQQRFQPPGDSNYVQIFWNNHAAGGVYDKGNNLFYGIFPGLPAPSGSTGLGGYYSGVGIGGSSNGTGTPIFGVLTSSQSASGIGHTAFTVYDDNTIESFYVKLGGQPAASNPAVASGTVYQNTTNAYQTLYLPITYNPTSTAAATAAVALGTSSTPAVTFTNSEPAGLTTGRVDTITLRVPPQWYWSLTLTNATVGTVTQTQE